MTELKMDMKSTCHVDAYDLDAFVFDLLGVRLEFAADQESGNDTSHEFTVTNEPLDGWEQEEIDKFISGKHVPFVSDTVLHWLCIKEKIPAGEYIVRVAW